MAEHYGAKIYNSEISEVTSEKLILSDGLMVSYDNLVPVKEALDDGNSYVRKGNQWFLLEFPVEEAPEDSKVYGRKDGEWFEVIIPDNLSVSKDHKYKLMPILTTTNTLTIQEGECLDDTNNVLMVIPSDVVLDITEFDVAPEPETEIYAFVIADSNGENATVSLSKEVDASDILIDGYVNGFKRRVYRVKLNTSSQFYPSKGKAKIGSNYKAVEITWDTRWTKNIPSGTISHIFPCPDDVEVVGFQRSSTGSGSSNITFDNTYLEIRSNNYSYTTTNLNGCRYGTNVNTVSSGLSSNLFSISGYVEDVQ